MNNQEFAEVFENEVFKEIDDLGCFYYEPGRWEKFGSVITKLRSEGKIIGLDELEDTSSFMNASYAFTHSDNRYRLRVQKIGNTFSVVKGDME